MYAIRSYYVMLKTPKSKGIKVSNEPDLKAHAEVTRKAATDGMVLLENKNSTLPIDSSVKKVAAFGNRITSYNVCYTKLLRLS